MKGGPDGYVSVDDASLEPFGVLVMICCSSNDCTADILYVDGVSLLEPSLRIKIVKILYFI